MARLSAASVRPRPRRLAAVVAGALLVAAVGASTSDALGDRLGCASRTHAGHRHVTRAFAISLAAPHALRPGRAVRLDLRLHNHSAHPLRVGRITMAATVDRAHVRAGCATRRNYVWQGMRASRRRLVLPARRTRTLRQIGVPASALPRLAMRNLDVAQDACKGALLRLSFAAHMVGGPEDRR